MLKPPTAIAKAEEMTKAGIPWRIVLELLDAAPARSATPAATIKPKRASSKRANAKVK